MVSANFEHNGGFALSPEQASETDRVGFFELLARVLQDHEKALDGIERRLGRVERRLERAVQKLEKATRK